MDSEFQKSIASVLANHGVRLGYLFGSQASGNTTPQSDTDIAVLLSDSLSREQRFEIRLRLATELSIALHGNIIDLVVLNDTTSILFRYGIIKEGKMIYEASEDERIAYEMKIMSEYFDFAPFIDTYNAQYVQANLQ